MKVILYTLWLITQSHATSQDKVMTCYQILRCDEVKTTCAIILFETGYLESYKLKVDNAQKHGNIFGFRLNNRYLSYPSYSAGVKYYIRWQLRHYTRFKRLYPNKSYHEFLVWRGYCNNMKKYLKTIKRIESL